MILFGDTEGINQLVHLINRSKIQAIVGASIRPQYHERLRVISHQLKVPFIVQPRQKSPDFPLFIEQLVSLEPSLFFINSYSMILNDQVLGIPMYGTINIHYSLLPNNRGANPIQWSILNQDECTGVTIHEVDQGIDTGPIIFQRETPISIADNWLTITARVKAITQKLLEEKLYLIENFNWDSSNQDLTQGRYNRRRTPADGRINWSDPVLHIYNLIRSLISPLPGAYYENDSQKFIIDQPTSLNEVISLKYKYQMNTFNIGNRFHLHPENPTENSDIIQFTLKKLPELEVLGTLRLSSIDWDKKVTRIECDCKLMHETQNQIIEFVEINFNLKGQFYE